jgi:hypothetical protein
VTAAATYAWRAGFDFVVEVGHVGAVGGEAFHRGELTLGVELLEVGL